MNLCLKHNYPPMSINKLSIQAYSQYNKRVEKHRSGKIYPASFSLTMEHSKKISGRQKN